MSAHGGTTPPPVEHQGVNVHGDGIEELQTKLALLQQIQELQAAIGYTPPATPHPRSAIPQNIKVPEVRYTMSLSEFRTYSKDCLDYKTLTGYTDNQIVLQMRLHMDSDLKQSIVDTNYILWRNNTEAIVKLWTKSVTVLYTGKHFTIWPKQGMKPYGNLQLDFVAVQLIVCFSAHMTTTTIWLTTTSSIIYAVEFLIRTCNKNYEETSKWLAPVNYHSNMRTQE